VSYFGRAGSGAELELCDECSDRLTLFVHLPPDCEAVDFRAIPLSCPVCQPGTLRMIGAVAAEQRAARRTPAEQAKALAEFKRRGRH
jgi:hypothetical protein